MSANHTPTPWSIRKNAERELRGPTGQVVSYMTAVWSSNPDHDVPPEVSAANATFIVQAVNAYDALMLDLDMREGDLVLLRKALEMGDPVKELLFRVEDMLRDTRAARVKATQ